MNTPVLNKVCFAICILAIVAGVLLGMTMVWTPGISLMLWRLMASVGIVFFGASAALLVGRAYGSGASTMDDKQRGTLEERSE